MTSKGRRSSSLEIVVSLAHTHQQLDETSSRQAETLRDDMRLIKREILSAQSLRFDEFTY